jgi:hypothetical protein
VSDIDPEEIMKNSKILAFTILESILVIFAIVIILFVLGGLYLKNSKLSTPGSPEGPTEIGTSTAEPIPAKIP